MAYVSRSRRLLLSASVTTGVSALLTSVSGPLAAAPGKGKGKPKPPPPPPPPAPPPAWSPAYRVPFLDGEVVAIAGDVATGPNGSGGSEYPTNVWADVRATEIGGAVSANAALVNGDSGTWLIESFSQGGAVAMAGTGGHHGTPTFGGALFDFSDARWKRIWTTQGNPGVDNITNQGPPPSQGGLPFVDLRTGTRTHGCLNYEPDLIEYYGSSTTHGAAPCWNPEHWPTGGANGEQLKYVPIVADPRNQTWEVSRLEPAAFNATTNPHGWPYPGEWNGSLGGRYPGNGFVMPCQRFDPPVAGTLAPTQSELPAPAHVWDTFQEMPTDEGGGPRGSIIASIHRNIGSDGQTSIIWSHRFDLHTGIWHRYSVNATGPGFDGNPTSPPPGGGPAAQSSGIAGAFDPVMKRVFHIGKRLSQSSSRVNYYNKSDRTWRNFSVGSGGVTPTDRTEVLVVDPVRRLLLVTGNSGNNFWAFDLQTLTPEPIVANGLGGWRAIPWTDVPGVQFHINQINANWRYCPDNGKFYRMVIDNPTPNAWPPPDITAMQRLTPPPIIATPRPDFYYTTEASSGRWTLDEIQLVNALGNPRPVPNAGPHQQNSVHGSKWFHYVPSLKCFAWFPLDHTSGLSASRRCVFLIKPY